MRRRSVLAIASSSLTIGLAACIEDTDEGFNEENWNLVSGWIEEASHMIEFGETNLSIWHEDPGNISVAEIEGTGQDVTVLLDEYDEDIRPLEPTIETWEFEQAGNDGTITVVGEELRNLLDDLYIALDDIELAVMGIVQAEGDPVELSESAAAIVETVVENSNDTTDRAEQYM